MKRWIKSQHKRPKLFAEPFAGGAHIGLAVAIENLADQVTLVELDENVAAVWNTIISGNYECLIDRIMDFNLTIENLETVFNQDNPSSNEHAFAVILHNRTSHRGITASGSGLLKKGENNKGIRSRWYPQTLKKRIEKIADWPTTRPLVGTWRTPLSRDPALVPSPEHVPTRHRKIQIVSKDAIPPLILRMLDDLVYRAG